MAVITRYIIVRNGVELGVAYDDKKEAEAYDKMLDAADDLAAFIKAGNLQIDIDDAMVERIAIFLAKNAAEVSQILKGVKAPGPVTKTSPKTADPSTAEVQPASELKSTPKGKSQPKK